jgi:uncharacterized protein YecT (DUF1311 family)
MTRFARLHHWRTVLTAALLTASASLPPSAVLAQQHDSQDVDCTNAQSQADMNYCAAMDYKTADDQLNAVYKQALKSQADLDKQNAEFDPNQAGALKALKKAQRAWIDYRDGECEGESYQAAGGTMQPMLEAGCDADLTRKRIKELQELIKGMGN